MAYQQPTDNPIKSRFDDFGKHRIQCARWKFEVRDVLNLKFIYTMLHDWLTEEGWAPREDTDFPETYYTQRENPKFGKEVWVRWRLEKKPEAAKGKFFHYTMDLNWKLIGWKDTEIVYKGQKMKTDRGEFEMECIGNLVIDKEQAWESSWFRNIKEIFVKRTYRDAIVMHRKIIYTDVYRLRDLVMSFLNQETFIPEKEAGEYFGKARIE